MANYFEVSCVSYLFEVSKCIFVYNILFSRAREERNCHTHETGEDQTQFSKTNNRISAAKLKYISNELQGLTYHHVRRFHNI